MLYRFITLLILLFAAPAWGANVYWRSNTTERDAITGMAAGDFCLVLGSDGQHIEYVYNGSAWVLPTWGASGFTQWAQITSDSSTYGGWLSGGQTFTDVNADSRPNHVWSVGYNIGTNGAPLVADQPAFRAFGVESHYNIGADPDVDVFELHIGGFYPASSSSEQRAISMYTNKSTSYSEISYRFDKISFLDSTNTNQYLVFNSDGHLDGDGATINVNGSSYFALNNNNTAYFKQHNAANSAFLNLPFYNDKNELYWNQPTFIQSSRAPNGSNFEGTVVTVQQTGTPTSNDAGILVLPQSGVTGNWYALKSYGYASTGLLAELYNYKNDNTNAHASLRLITNNSGGGNPFIYYEIGGQTAWASGVDNADGDQFKISNSTAIGTSDKIVLPQAGGIRIVTGTKGTCDASSRGTIFYVAGNTGEADTLEVCRKDASNNYAWAALF